MAGTVQYSFNAVETYGTTERFLAKTSGSYVEAALGGNTFYWTVGTAAENLTLTDVGTLGSCLIFNRGAHFVDVGIDATGIQALIRLQPEGGASGLDWCFFPLKPGVTIRAQADTASTVLEITVKAA